MLPEAAVTSESAHDGAILRLHKQAFEDSCAVWARQQDAMRAFDLDSSDIPAAFSNTKHNLSLVQCSQRDGAPLVTLVNWADIKSLYGQIIQIDELNRAKASVFAVYPNYALRDVVFI